MILGKSEAEKEIDEGRWEEVTFMLISPPPILNSGMEIKNQLRLNASLVQEENIHPWHFIYFE